MGELWLFLFTFLSCGPPAGTFPRWPVNTTANSVARHSRDSTALLSRPLSLRLFFVERAQDTARSASSSCRSRRVAGTFEPRVSQDVDRQPLDVRKDGCCVGPQAKGLRGRQWLFFREAQNCDPEASHRTAQRHSAKNKSFNTSSATPWHYPDPRHTTPAHLKWASPGPPMGPWAISASPKS